jgi:PAS domain S-box-containing protein
VLVLAFGTGAFLNGRHLRAQAGAKGYQEIASVSELKAQQIGQWRSERLSDVRLAAASRYARNAVSAWMDASGDSARLTADVMEWLSLVKNVNLYYDALLLDGEGRVLLSTSGGSGKAGTESLAALRHARSIRGAVLGELFMEASGNVFLDAMAPLQLGSGEPEAYIDLKINARSALFPMIQSWPTPSPTAETLLVRADGDSVLFLNDLRHRAGASMQLRFPLASTRIPAVQAVLGRVGKFEGTDYRGVDVLADMRPLAGSGWYVITKIDSVEVYSEASARVLMSSIIIAMLLLLAGMGTALGLRHSQAQLYRKLLHAERQERELQEEFRTTLYSIGDAVISTDPEGRVWHMNPEAERLTGWTELEARGSSLPQVFHIINEQSRREVESPVHRVLQEGSVVGLANHTLLISRDGV